MWKLDEVRDKYEFPAKTSDPTRSVASKNKRMARISQNPGLCGTVAPDTANRMLAIDNMTKGLKLHMPALLAKLFSSLEQMDLNSEEVQVGVRDLLRIHATQIDRDEDVVICLLKMAAGRFITEHCHHDDKSEVELERRLLHFMQTYQHVPLLVMAKLGAQTQ